MTVITDITRLKLAEEEVVAQRGQAPRRARQHAGLARLHRRRPQHRVLQRPLQPRCIRCRRSCSSPAGRIPICCATSPRTATTARATSKRCVARRVESLRNPTGHCLRGPHAERQRLSRQPPQGRLRRHRDRDHRHHRAQARRAKACCDAKRAAEDAHRQVMEKNRMLESLSSKLSKYLSPQIYKSIFSGEKNAEVAAQRKKLTIFFSDIAGFTETTDLLESEELTSLLNQYLREMSSIALEHGATIDKFIGDAIMLFFGDPETAGAREDAHRLRQDGDRHAAAHARPAGRMARARPGARVPASHRHQHRLLHGRQLRQRRPRRLHDHRQRGEPGGAAADARRSRRHPARRTRPMRWSRTRSSTEETGTITVKGFATAGADASRGRPA